MNNFVKVSFALILLAAMTCSFAFAQEKEQPKILVEMTLKGKLFEKVHSLTSWQNVK